MKPHPEFPVSAVIGTGMMGPGIAATLALGGSATVLISRTPEGAARGLGAARACVSLLGEHGLAAPDAAAWALEHLSSTSELEPAVRGAALVVESGPEDMAFKQGLFTRLDALAPPASVVASNTSGLSITAIGLGCARRERILTTHFWNPPHLMPLVEIVLSDRTSPELAGGVHAFLAHCGKTPVLVKKDRPGQLGNRLQMAVVREALYMIEEGIADAADIDLAIQTGFGLRLPVYPTLTHQDIVGLDLGVAVLDYVSRDLANTAGAPRLALDLVANGHLGAKTGRGYRDWQGRDAGRVKARRDKFLLEFLKSEFSLVPHK